MSKDNIKLLNDLLMLLAVALLGSAIDRMSKELKVIKTETDAAWFSQGELRKVVEAKFVWTDRDVENVTFKEEVVEDGKDA
jgi:hypothetical protein